MSDVVSQKTNNVFLILIKAKFIHKWRSKNTNLKSARLFIPSLVGRLPKREIVNLSRDPNISQAIRQLLSEQRECEDGKLCIIFRKTGRPQALCRNETNLLKKGIGMSSRKPGRPLCVSNKTLQRTKKKSLVYGKRRRNCNKYTEVQLEGMPILNSTFRHKMILKTIQTKLNSKQNQNLLTKF